MEAVFKNLINNVCKHETYMCTKQIQLYATLNSKCLLCTCVCWGRVPALKELLIPVENLVFPLPCLSGHKPSLSLFLSGLPACELSFPISLPGQIQETDDFKCQTSEALLLRGEKPGKHMAARYRREWVLGLAWLKTERV